MAIVFLSPPTLFLFFFLFLFSCFHTNLCPAAMVPGAEVHQGNFGGLQQQLGNSRKKRQGPSHPGNRHAVVVSSASSREAIKVHSSQHTFDCLLHNVWLFSPCNVMVCRIQYKCLPHVVRLCQCHIYYRCFHLREWSSHKVWLFSPIHDCLPVSVQAFALYSVTVLHTGWLFPSYSIIVCPSGLFWLEFRPRLSVDIYFKTRMKRDAVFLLACEMHDAVSMFLSWRSQTWWRQPPGL